MNVEFPHRLGERSQTGPEFSSIERKRMDRSTFLGATGMIGMIVGIVLAEAELDLGVRFEEADHRAGVRQKRADARFVEVVSGFVLDVGSRLLEQVLDT